MRTFGSVILLAVMGLVPWTLSVAYGDYHEPAPPAAQPSAEAQLRTAIQHARELAAGSAALSGIQTHLQQAVNCLEGQAGRNFKAASGNPCQGMGNGFLTDARDKAGAVFLARHATDLAVDTLTTVRDVATAQGGARSVAATLEEARTLLK